MPMVTIRVRSVEQDWRQMPDGSRRRKFTVCPDLIDTPSPAASRLYGTWDPWKASLCQRARDTGKLVELGTRDTSYGPEIVTVKVL